LCVACSDADGEGSGGAGFAAVPEPHPHAHGGAGVAAGGFDAVDEFQRGAAPQVHINVVEVWVAHCPGVLCGCVSSCVFVVSLTNRQVSSRLLTHAGIFRVLLRSCARERKGGSGAGVR